MTSQRTKMFVSIINKIKMYQLILFISHTIIYNKNNLNNLLETKYCTNKLWKDTKSVDNSIISKTFIFYSNTEGIDIIFHFKSDTYKLNPQRVRRDRNLLSKERSLNLQLKSYFPS